MKVMGFIKKEYDNWLDGNYKKEIPKTLSHFQEKN
ncbi:MAG: hypothetical protein CM15mP102_19690 [Flavobacteriales bacterium]|nr:MAG: hypothetical protein CM15mP102_19690 [Flavobacteriales bacterium]